MEKLIAEDKFNKLLLDLEILGLIKVSWITKDERRIEVFVVEKEDGRDRETKQRRPWKGITRQVFQD